MSLTTDRPTALVELLEAIQGEAAAYCEEHDGCSRIRSLAGVALSKLAVLGPWEEQAEQVRKALQVITTTDHIRSYLRRTDPKALEQALNALGTCANCGQGSAGTPGAEHKSSCRFWREEIEP